ncbi:hypothetical protein BH10BAC2_BH10BAC2_05310 [soil metagenome]
MRSLLFVIVILTLHLCSCSKETVNNHGSAASATTDNAVTTQTLTLQPGLKDGNDLWTKNWINHPAYADTCDSKVGLIKGLCTTLKGSVVYTRSVIKFDGLSNVPAGATILSATLYLYGPTPQSKDVKKHLPSGNSSYPGSDRQDNTCLLQRITSAWNVASISWNNPPVVTTANQVILKASDKQWQYDVAINVTEMVKVMVSAPNVNNGFLMRLQTEERSRSMGFLSANSPETDRHPKLVVTYSL